MLVIPAIDIIDNKVVRLTKGDYNTSKIYSDNPIDLVEKFIQHGIKRIQPSGFLDFMIPHYPGKVCNYYTVI